MRAPLAGQWPRTASSSCSPRHAVQARSSARTTKGISSARRFGQIPRPILAGERADPRPCSGRGALKVTVMTIGWPPETDGPIRRQLPRARQAAGQTRSATKACPAGTSQCCYRKASVTPCRCRAMVEKLPLGRRARCDPLAGDDRLQAFPTRRFPGSTRPRAGYRDAAGYIWVMTRTGRYHQTSRPSACRPAASRSAGGAPRVAAAPPRPSPMRSRARCRSGLSCSRRALRAQASCRGGSPHWARTHRFRSRACKTAVRGCSVCPRPLARFLRGPCCRIARTPGVQCGDDRRRRS